MTTQSLSQGTTYRVAFIGCGGIARAHADAYRALPECEIVAAADISKEALTGFGDQYGVLGRYDSYEEMLATEHPDIVSVCTWPPQHPEPVIAAARAGVTAIVCEKPMAVTLADADRMNEAARASGTRLIVNHQRRFNARYSQARALIEAGAIGEVQEVLAVCGGDLLTDGTHAVDLTRFLVGDLRVEWVFGQIDLQQPQVTNTSVVGYQQWHQTGMRYGHPVEGGALAQIQFASGPRGLLETGRVARPAGYQWFRVLGSEGRLEISGDPRPDQAEFLRMWGRGDRGWRQVDLASGNAFALAMRALLDSLATDAPHTLDGMSARSTLEVLIAVMESALRHERMTLPISTNDHPLWRAHAARPGAGTATEAR